MRRNGIIFGLLIAALAVGAANAAETKSLPDRALSLRDCVQMGLDQSPRLSAAAQTVEGARASLRRSYASYLPQATFTTQHGRSGGLSFLETAGGTIPLQSSTLRHEADLILSQTLWQSGRRQVIEQARANYHATQSDQLSTQQLVVQNVAQTYYSALAAESLVDVAKSALKGAQDHLLMVKARAEAGEVARVDVVPAEADVANAELELIRAENDAALTKARLKNEMGVPPTYAIVLADTFSPGATPVPELPELLSQAYAKRPEVASSKASQEAGLQALMLAQVRQGPLISFGGQYDEGLSGANQRSAWSITASAQVFIYDGGARKSDVQAAKASLKVAESQHAQLLNGIGLEVESARLAVKTAQKSIEAATKSLDRSEAQLAAAEGKYREGAGIYLEVTDAQSAVTRARTNRIQTILDYHQALVNLQRALGTLSLATLPPAAP